MLYHLFSKRKNFELKKKLLPSLFELPEEKEGKDETSQKNPASQETTNKKVYLELF